MSESPASQAVRLYNDRRRRAEFFPNALFSDSGWDFLLWLFIETERGRRVSITDAARAIRVSTMTACRWMAVLREMKLVDNCSTEERVMLADDGHRCMMRFLADAV